MSTSEIDYWGIAESIIFEDGAYNDAFPGLLKGGFSREDAEKIAFLVGTAIVTIDWPDWVTV